MMTPWLIAMVIAAAPVTLDDFESGEALSARWAVGGPVKVMRIDAPADASVDGVGGKMLRLEATGAATIQRKAMDVRPTFTGAERIVIRVHAPDASKDRPVEIEVQCVDGAHRATWWRKLSIDEPGWQRVELPLRWFRPGGGGLLPRWEGVDRWGVHLRGAATVEIDGVELVPGDRPDAAYLSPADIAAAAFGDVKAARIAERDGFVLITDAKELDTEAVLDALKRMRQAVENDLPALTQLPGVRPAVLVVFAQDAAYRAFWPRFAERFNGEIAEPRSDGFTALGIATTAYSDKFGKVRPVYVHEACHAMLAERLRIGNRGEWLHEGMAVRAALPWMKQSLGPLVRAGLADPARRMAFDELLSGKPISTDRYWQATSVIEWLLDDAERAKAFHAAVTEMTKTGATDLRAMAKRDFGMTVTEMEDAWMAWAKTRYAE